MALTQKQKAYILKLGEARQNAQQMQFSSASRCIEDILEGRVMGAPQDEDIAEYFVLAENLYLVGLEHTFNVIQESKRNPDDQDQARAASVAYADFQSLARRYDHLQSNLLYREAKTFGKFWEQRDEWIEQFNSDFLGGIENRPTLHEEDITSEAFLLNLKKMRTTVDDYSPKHWEAGRRVAAKAREVTIEPALGSGKEAVLSINRGISGMSDFIIGGAHSLMEVVGVANTKTGYAATIAMKGRELVDQAGSGLSTAKEYGFDIPLAAGAKGVESVTGIAAKAAAGATRVVEHTPRFGRYASVPVDYGQRLLASLGAFGSRATEPLRNEHVADAGREAAIYTGHALEWGAQKIDVAWKNTERWAQNAVARYQSNK